jgi:hypothetical protein
MNYFSGSLAFTAGCICFTIDAIRVRPVNKVLLAGCILFDVGCVFFLLDSAPEVSQFMGS